VGLGPHLEGRDLLQGRHRLSRPEATDGPGGRGALRRADGDVHRVDGPPLQRGHRRAGAVDDRDSQGTRGLPQRSPRHPNAAAELPAAYTILLKRFAIEKGLITPTDADTRLVHARKILVELVEDQGEAQEETKPGRKFCEYLGAALRAGECFLRNKLDADLPPDLPEACGWEKHHLFQGTDRSFRGNPQVPTYQKPKYKPCVGFCDDSKKMLYIDKTVAVRVVNAWARQNADTTVFQAPTLGRNLLYEGRCVPFQEGGRQRSASNQSIQGIKGYYFRIPRDHIIDPEL